jgi:hypothetical protein
MFLYVQNVPMFVCNEIENKPNLKSINIKGILKHNLTEPCI